MSKTAAASLVVSGLALAMSTLSLVLRPVPDSTPVRQVATVSPALTPDGTWAMLMQKPEMLGELVKAFQIKAADATRTASVQSVDAALPEIFRPGDPVMGNPAAPRRIAVFFDYQCPHCREAEPALRKAVADDPGLAVVLREFPVLGPASVLASRAALAAKEQGLYMPMHDALLAQPLPLSATKIEDAARAAGVDLSRMNVDMASEDIGRDIESGLALARRLDIQGTPSFVGRSVGMLVGYGNDGRFADFVAHVKAD